MEMIATLDRPWSKSCPIPGVFVMGTVKRWTQTRVRIVRPCCNDQERIVPSCKCGISHHANHVIENATKPLISIKDKKKKKNPKTKLFRFFLQPSSLTKCFPNKNISQITADQKS
jgi:hypothetical protein